MMVRFATVLIFTWLPTIIWFIFQCPDTLCGHAMMLLIGVLLAWHVHTCVWGNQR